MIDWCGGNKLYTILWCGRNKSDGLHNKCPYHKWQYKVTFLHTKRSHIQTSKAHDNLCFPLRRDRLLFLSYTLCKNHGDLHLSFLHFILWQAPCVGKILIYISNWMYVSMNYYCWHHPKVNTLGGNTISPYLSQYPAETL